MPSRINERQARLANTPAYKIPVRCATTAELSTLSGLPTIDGVVLAEGDRVLVKNQSNTIQNGIYSATIGTWTHASDANGEYDLVNGTMVLVTNGTTNALTNFRVTATDPVTPGTTAITWTEISSEESGSAATSAAEAAASAAAASASASSASTSATNAATSATAAQTAETNAETAETNAEAAQAAAEAAAASTVENLTGTSTSSVLIGTGSKSFTTQSGKNFAAGRHLLVTSNANPDTHRMAGIVTSYSGTALTVNVEVSAGSGTRSDWTIRVDGERGPAGGGAPETASYVTLATNATLSSERVLTAGSGVSLTDAGAGSTVTAALDIAGLTAETAPAVGDELPIRDVSASTNDKITLANLFKVIAALTAETAPAVDDEIALYDLSETAANKITLANLLTVVNALTEDTAPDEAADFLLSYDTSASAVKKVKPDNIHLIGGLSIAAWARFTVSGGVVTLQADYNVTSVTRNSSGLFTINFTNALASTSYSYTASVIRPSNTNILLIGTSTGETKSTSAFQVRCENGAGTEEDPAEAFVMIYLPT